MSPFILENTYPPLMSSVAMKEAQQNQEQVWQLKEACLNASSIHYSLGTRGRPCFGLQVFPICDMTPFH